MEKNIEISFLLDFYGDMLTEKQREVIEYYYDDDLSLGEIAYNQGITRQGVRDAIKRAESSLFEMEERLGLAAKFNRMQDGLRAVLSAAEKIEEYNRNFTFSREINNCAVEIKDIVKTLCE